MVFVSWWVGDSATELLSAVPAAGQTLNRLGVDGSGDGHLVWKLRLWWLADCG